MHRIPCGYRIPASPPVEYTDEDIAWFRHPIREE